MTRPAWSIALQWVLWAAAMGAIMAWLARSRARTRPAADAQRLTHPRSTLIVGLACSFLFSGVALASALWPGKTGSPGISLAFLAFAALGVPLILDYRNARHTLTEDGLRYGRTWGGGGTLRWREVRRLRSEVESAVGGAHFSDAAGAAGVRPSCPRPSPGGRD